MCEVCLQNPCHPRCPNYSPINTHIYCCKCGEIIEIGEEYLENLNGEAAHLDCFYSIRDLLEWHGEDIKVIEEENIEYMDGDLQY